MNSTSLCAITDFGSSSLHIPVIHEVARNIQTLTRIKREMRLTVGLSGDSELSVETVERDW